MLPSSLYAMLTPVKTTSPQKLLQSDCITLYCDVSKNAYWITELKYRINFEKCQKMFDWHAKNRTFWKISEFYSFLTNCAVNF